MGAWGPGGLENDDALDLLGDLMDDLQESGAKAPFKALGIIFRDALNEESRECLEAADGTSAIAAAELVAAAIGKPATDLPEPAREWLAAIGGARPPAPMVRQAIEAVRAVLERETSELRELWADAEPADYDAWQAGARELLTRLGA